MTGQYVRETQEYTQTGRQAERARVDNGKNTRIHSERYDCARAYNITKNTKERNRRNKRNGNEKGRHWRRHTISQGVRVTLL